MAYTWDKRGNQLSNGTLTYVYDGAGRMVQVKQGTSTVSTYVYNGDGLRVRQVVGSQTTYYTWDVAAGLPEVLSDGSTLYLPGVGQWNGVEGWTYYLPDSLGSVRQLADVSGQVVQRYEYGPFGESLGAEGGQSNAMRYTGEWWDGNVGLLYLRARWYDPATGRFLSKDPFRGFTIFPQTQHPYVYCQNNALKYTDPSGQIPLLLTAAIGAAIGGGVNATIQVAQIMYSDPNLTFQEAVSRIDMGQVVGAAAAGGFMGLTLGIGAGGLGATMILGAVGGGLGGQIGALVEAAWDEGAYMWHGCRPDIRRFIQTARNSGLGDLAKIGIDGGAGAISAGVGYGVSSYLSRWIYLPSSSSSAPAREVVRIYPRLGLGVIRDLGTAPVLPVDATKQTLIYASELTYEVARGFFEEFLQTGVGGWAEDRIEP